MSKYDSGYSYKKQSSGGYGAPPDPVCRHPITKAECIPDAKTTSHVDKLKTIKCNCSLKGDDHITYIQSREFKCQDCPDSYTMTREVIKCEKIISKPKFVGDITEIKRTELRVDTWRALVVYTDKSTETSTKKSKGMCHHVSFDECPGSRVFEPMKPCLVPMTDADYQKMQKECNDKLQGMFNLPGVAGNAKPKDETIWTYCYGICRICKLKFPYKQGCKKTKS